MRKWTYRIVAAIVVLGLLTLAAGLVAYRMLQWGPSFYARAVQVPRDERGAQVTNWRSSCWRCRTESPETPFGT